ncbi:hypothetical protein AB1N83_008650 [Pleurotus pulmonarius]
MSIVQWSTFAITSPTLTPPITPYTGINGPRLVEHPQKILKTRKFVPALNAESIVDVSIYDSEARNIQKNTSEHVQFS